MGQIKMTLAVGVQSCRDLDAEIVSARRSFPENAGLFNALLIKNKALGEALDKQHRGESVQLLVYTLAMQCAVLSIRIMEENDAVYKAP